MKLLYSIENKTFSESKEILEKKGLVITEYDNLYLVKYNKDLSDMTDDEVRHCRGIILEKESNNLVCVPPFKSIKFEDFSCITPQLSEPIYEEFLDGTMINLFWYEKWMISTRSRIGANCTWFSNKTFNQLFNESSTNLNYDCLDKNNCYTFVLQHPDNRIVKEYKKPEITLVSVRKLDGIEYYNIDLEEVRLNLKKLNIDIKIPKRYTFETFLLALDFVNTQDYEFQGLVMKHNGFRSKIRNSKYNRVKQLRGNTHNMKFNYLMLRHNNELNNFIDYFPEYTEEFNSYKNELYNATKTLWDLYQTYYISVEKKNLKKTDIPYEYRPLCYTLHGIYLAKRQNGVNNKMQWKDVKNFVNNLHPAKQLFVINYKLRIQDSNNEDKDRILLEEGDLEEV